MCSFTRSETEGRAWERRKDTRWGFSSRGTYGSDVVVEVLVLGERRGDFGDGEFAAESALEFDARCVIGAFDTAVEFRAPWREDEEREFVVLAGSFELGHELGAAIDLKGFDPRVVIEQGVEEAASVVSGGGREDAAEHDLGTWADGAELLECFAVARDGHVVDTDELAGCGGAHTGGESLGVAVGEVASLLGFGTTAEEGVNAGGKIPKSAK